LLQQPELHAIADAALAAWEAPARLK